MPNIMLIAAPLMFVFLVANGMLRAVSDTVTPLMALSLSIAISLALTPALIRGWIGLPPLGIAGAAWATLVATACAMVWLAFYLRRRQHPLAPDRQLLRHLRVDTGLLKTVLRLGLPTGLFMVTGSLADLVLLSVVNGFGAHATAAWGAISQVSSYALFPAMSIAITASILAAQAIGAGRTERLGAIVRTGLLMNLVVTGTLVLLAWLLARHIVGLFITNPQVVDLTEGLLRIAVWSSLIFGLASVLTGVMRASGTVLVPTVISLACIGLLLAPLGWAFSRSFGLPGVWVSYPVTYLCALLLQAVYFQMIWRKRPIHMLV